MKLSSFFYLLVLISALLIPARQTPAFFFDFDFSSRSDSYGWDYYYYDSRYEPYYWSNYDPYYHTRHRPRPRWSQPYHNRWGEPYWNRCVGSPYDQPNYAAVDDSGLSTTEPEKTK
ncbi:MAG: hypothetical protein QNL62_19975 [Gammaproteobacteria bacterium]|nr:hypothetical protein [Gammaproteobacteria bacterium]